MTRLNYFERYESKDGWHEDQLTRAFLVILSKSVAAQLCFYDLVREAVLREANKRNIAVTLPSLSEVVMDAEDVRLDTQRTSLDEYQAANMVSVLLTDEHISSAPEVKRSERDARYDGVVQFGEKVTFFIENKPSHGHVWEEQLSPSTKDVGEGAALVPVPAIVRWRDVIAALKNVAAGRHPGIGGAEKSLIDDFFAHVTAHFTWLNPYRTLKDCAGKPELIQRRIESLLQEIAARPELVLYRPGWDAYCINVELEELKYVGLTIQKWGEAKDEVDELRIDMYFGDTVRQARALYGRDLTYQALKAKAPDWYLRPNFHLSFMSTHLVWFETPEGAEARYYEYWRENAGQIGQFGREDLRKGLEEWARLGLITVDAAKEAELEQAIWNTRREAINVCPGFGLHYAVPYKDALAWDKGTIKENKLMLEVARRMREGLAIVTNEPGAFVKDVG